MRRIVAWSVIVLSTRIFRAHRGQARTSSPQVRCMSTAHAQLALAGGAFLARPFAPKDNPDADLERRERRFSASCDGFDVHCAVRITADDDQGRERLVRYCARPAFALSRIELLPDGRIAYLLKTPRRGRTHRIMSPMEFMARLAALIAPPRIPLVRYHGVFAPRSSWRALVTPRPPARAPSPQACATSAPAFTPAPASPAPASPARTNELAPARTEAHAEPVVLVDATMITVAHWARLDDGALLARARYVDWATLMKRSFGFNVLRCPRCARKMRVLSTITDPMAIRRILQHLCVRSEPLTKAPARDPTWEQIDLGLDADAA